MYHDLMVEAGNSADGGKTLSNAVEQHLPVHSMSVLSLGYKVTLELTLHLGKSSKSNQEEL